MFDQGFEVRLTILALVRFPNFLLHSLTYA